MSGFRQTSTPPSCADVAVAAARGRGRSPLGSWGAERGARCSPCRPGPKRAGNCMDQ